MKAIFKKELKQYFHSVSGYVYLTIFLFLSGYYFCIGNILGRSSDIRSFFSSVVMVVMFIMPMLTMRSFAEERKIRTDQLFYSSPNPLIAVVMGKYLAVFAMFAIGLSITLFYMAIIAYFGELQAFVVIGNYFGILVTASAFISIGIFISSLTENQMVAGVLSYSLLLGLWLTGFAGKYASHAIIRRLAMYISPSSKFDEFAMGVFSFSSIVYYVSITGFFLFITTLTLENRRLN